MTRSSLAQERLDALICPLTADEALKLDRERIVTILRRWYVNNDDMSHLSFDGLVKLILSGEREPIG